MELLSITFYVCYIFPELSVLTQTVPAYCQAHRSQLKCGTGPESSNLKAVLHGTTCNIDFSRNNVARKTKHRVTSWFCRGQFWAQHSTPQCLASFWFGFKNSQLCSIFVQHCWQQEKLMLQVVPCNTAFIQSCILYVYVVQVLLAECTTIVISCGINFMYDLIFS